MCEDTLVLTGGTQTHTHTHTQFKSAKHANSLLAFQWTFHTFQNPRPHLFKIRQARNDGKEISILRQDRASKVSSTRLEQKTDA